MSENEGGHQWILGVVLGLAGSIAINTGNNMQSLGLNRLQQDKVHPVGPSEHEMRRSICTSESGASSCRGSASRKVTKEKGRKSPDTSNVDENTTTHDHIAESQNDGNKKNCSSDEHTAVRQNEEESSAQGQIVISINLPREEARQELAGCATSQQRSPLESKIWIVGTVIFVVGTILNFYSYSFAAQSMLASLESVQFLTNLLFGKFLLGEAVTKQMVFGTFLAIIGTTVAVQFSSKETLELNTEELKALYRNGAFLAYVGVVILLLIGLDQSYRRYEQKQKEGKPYKNSHMIMAVKYSIWSALIGTQSVVQAKVIAELVTVQARGVENVFSSWFTYVTVIAWLITAAIWIFRLQDALTKFSPIFIIPLLQSNFIFLAIISGGIFFQEFNAFTVGQWIGFWTGVFVMSFGLALLVLSKNNENMTLEHDKLESPIQNEQSS